MEAIVKSVLDNHEKAKKPIAKMSPSEKDKELEAVLGACRTVIKVVGTGGAGNNTLTRLMEVGVKGIEALAVNTDAQDLLYARASEKILIGKNITHGLGAGSNPSVGEESAKENLEELRAALDGSDMVFIACGLGGGTGTGSAPVIAEVAKSCGALTIAVVTLPFSEEGVMRWENARRGLEKLKKNSDTVIVVQNDKLLELVPDLPLNAAFKVADEILVNAVRGITELVTEKGLVNLDFADIKAIMKEGGTAMIGLGESTSENKAWDAVEKAVLNPLLDIDITGAKSALINVTGGSDMTLKDARTVMKAIAERLDPAARVIWGARLDQNMSHSIRVMLIVTGLKVKGKSAAEVEKAIQAEDEEPLEFEAATVSPPPAPPKKKTSDVKGKRVFSEIFEEETRGDINVLLDAVEHLGDGDEKDKALCDIKNACASLKSSAQLFTYDTIANFVGVVREVSERALAGEFELSRNLIVLFQKVPETLFGMIANDPQAITTAENITQKFESLKKLLRHSAYDDNGHHPVGVTVDDGDGRQKNLFEIADIASESDASEGKKKTKKRPVPEVKASLPEMHFAQIDDAVDYVKKLFEGDFDPRLTLEHGGDGGN